jgi:small-conductance mechanosensitive channel
LPCLRGLVAGFVLTQVRRGRSASISMSKNLNFSELLLLFRQASYADTWPAWIVVLCSLLAAWLACWFLNRHQKAARLIEAEGTLWLGRSGRDGVLLPLLALGLTTAAQTIDNTAQAGLLEPTVFQLMVPIFVAWVLLRLSIRAVEAVFIGSSKLALMQRVMTWLAGLGILLWITGVLPLAWEEMEAVRWQIGSFKFSLRRLVEGSITACVVLVGVMWVATLIEKQLLRGSGNDLSIRKMVANIVRALLFFLGLMLALSALGIDLTALSVVGGAVGVGIGFGLQKIAANYVSGYVILAERSLRIGDVVKVDNFEGRITDIRTRYTVVRSIDGREAIIPNEILITQRVENSSLADRKVLVVTKLQVAYGTNIRTLITDLEKLATQAPRVLSDPWPSCQLMEFAADGIVLGIHFWIRDPENGAGSVKSEVNLLVLDHLNAQGIEIPYPQRVVHTL